MTWLLLALAILAEVAATTALKLSDGFTRLGFAGVVVVGYAASFALLAKILTRGMSLGIVYATWSALGVALIVMVDVVWFDNRLSGLQIAGLVSVVAGVAALHLGGSAA